MPIPKPKAGQDEQTYVSECIPAIIDEYGQEQSAAICYATYRRDNMSKMSPDNKRNAIINFANDFRGIKLADDGLEGACWPGYEAIGTKDMDGREVPNCVPIKED